MLSVKDAFRLATGDEPGGLGYMVHEVLNIAIPVMVEHEVRRQLDDCLGWKVNDRVNEVV